MVRLFDMPHHLIYEGVPAPAEEEEEAGAGEAATVCMYLCYLGLRWIEAARVM